MKYLMSTVKAVQRTRSFVLATLFSLIACSDPTPIATEWTQLKAKEDSEQQLTFRTAGHGQGPVSWWAGGYLWEGGSFTVELIDVRAKKAVLSKVYHYGDAATGNIDAPLFQWWHAEEKAQIILKAGRVYRMKLKTKNLAQPGAGWGLWLYPIGETPRRRESPKEE